MMMMTTTTTIDYAILEGCVVVVRGQMPHGKKVMMVGGVGVLY